MASHTFVICAYKKSVFLEECILSLRAQTVQSNIVMVTSTPNKYIKALADRYNIPLAINEGEGGIAQDWNFGYSQGIGEYVTIVHQDDYYAPNYLEKALKNLKEAKNPLIFFCDYGEIRNGEKIDKSTLLRVKRCMLLPLRLKWNQKRKWIRRRILSFGNPICCPSVTYCVKNLPAPVFEIKYKSNVDWQTWERISKFKGEFVYLPEILMYHRIHEESTTSELIGESIRWKEDYEMFCRFWPKAIAKSLVKIYKKSEKSNDISGED